MSKLALRNIVGRAGDGVSRASWGPWGLALAAAWGLACGSESPSATGSGGGSSGNDTHGAGEMTSGQATGDGAEQPGPKTFAGIESCFYLAPDMQAACADAFVEAYAERYHRTTAELLADLEGARSMSKVLENTCHPVAHAIGRFTFLREKTVPAAFEACNETCHSGCYHGVMERVFAVDGHPTRESIAAIVPTLCEPAKFPNPTTAVLFQCYHGAGHAILYSMDYQLESSLDLCGLFPGAGEGANCRGGVFMENITAEDPTRRDLDPSDPHYPCSKLGGQLNVECYSMQTSIMYAYGLTDEQVAAECALAKDGPGGDASAQVCMTSMGRDLSSLFRTGDAERLRAACEDLPPEFAYAERCVQGGMAALCDNTWDGRFAMPFCAMIKGEALRTSCFSMVARYLVGFYGFDRAHWDADCDAFAGEAAPLCHEQGPF